MNQQDDSPEHPFILASRVNGTPVYDKDGNKLGHVDDLSIEKASGRVIYAIMSFGGFLGLGEKFHPLPWALLDYDLERMGFTVPLDAAALRDAPNYERRELVALGGASQRDYGETIYGYYAPYGITPYW